MRIMNHPEAKINNTEVHREANLNIYKREHALAAGAPPRIPLGEVTTSLDPLAGGDGPGCLLPKNPTSISVPHAWDVQPFEPRTIRPAGLNLQSLSALCPTHFCPFQRLCRPHLLIQGTAEELARGRKGEKIKKCSKMLKTVIPFHDDSNDFCPTRKSEPKAAFQ